MVWSFGHAQFGIDTFGPGEFIPTAPTAQGGSRVKHDFDRFPELTNGQMPSLYHESPHKQIFESFPAFVESVHDGDTITVSTSFRDFPFRVRFGKINTKELSEGGQEAETYVRDRLTGKSIEVLVDSNNRVGRYGRLIGEVMVGGINLGDELMKKGLATPFERRKDGQIPRQDKLFRIQQWL